MPAATKKSIKKRSNSKMNGGEGEESITKFTSSRLPSPPPSTAAAKSVFATAANISAPKSTSRLLTVPATAATVAAATVAAASKPQGMNSVVRYVIIFIILGVLALGLYLYLEKPAGKSITHLFDPLFKNKKAQAPAPAQAPAKKAPASEAVKQAQAQALALAAPPATETLQQTLDQKAIVNNIDRDSSGTTQHAKKFKSKPVVVPEAADAADTTKTPKSKAGFCYIGEDRGFRSCVDVGEGDVCMSGDIFPTEAICINPNLRE